MNNKHDPFQADGKTKGKTEELRDNPFAQSPPPIPPEVWEEIQKEQGRGGAGPSVAMPPFPKFEDMPLESVSLQELYVAWRAAGELGLSEEADTLKGILKDRIKDLCCKAEGTAGLTP